MEIVDFPNYKIYPCGKVMKGKKIMSQRIRNGYYAVSLSNKESRKSFSVHRLLGQYFISNPENKPCIDHINRDKTDNRLCNLRWATHSENNFNRVLNCKEIYYDTDRNRTKPWRWQKCRKTIRVETKALALWIKFYYHILK